MDNVVILNDRRPLVFKELTCDTCQKTLSGYFPYTTDKLKKVCCGVYVDFKTLKEIEEPKKLDRRDAKFKAIYLGLCIVTASFLMTVLLHKLF